MGNTGKTRLITSLQVLCLLFFLYIFIIALGLLSDGFKVLSGSVLNQAIANYQDLLNMPIFGLIAGILITVMVQSSSTSSSIMVSMVGAGLLTVQQAIFMIMGANIGTSITSTLVAFGNAAERDEFARAMSCAVLGDAKNWLSVLILLPVEAASGLIYTIVKAITKSMESTDQANVNKIDFFSVLTEWIENYIISVDSTGLGNETYNGSFVKYCKQHADNCSFYCDLFSSECHIGDCFKMPDDYDCSWNDLSPNQTFSTLFGDDCIEVEKHMFMKSCLSDETIGGIVVGIALFSLFLSLALIVKTLKGLLGAKVTALIHRNINKDLCHPFESLTPWLFLVIGAVITILVQSSSITLSTLTPLCGIGVVDISRAYSMNVGADIGTTATSLIAALASSGDGFVNSLQVSLAHLFFNIFGVLLFFALPITRKLPIACAQFIGKRTARYRWFAVAYIVVMFLIMPLAALGIGLGSEIALYVAAATLVLILLSISIINTLQIKKPKVLPARLRSWKWLPLAMRSLKPYDELICSKCKCCSTRQTSEEKRQPSSEANHSFSSDEL